MTNTAAGRRPENLAFGAIIITAAFFCVAMVTVLAKVSGQYTSIGVVLLVQNVMCLLFIVPIVARDGWELLKTQHIRMHILRAVMGTGCWWALFVAITLIPLTNAILLTYSAPLWMPMVAWAITRQKVAGVTWLGALIGFAGIIVVLQPQGQSFGLGDLSALAGALFLAVGLMSVRWLGATEPITRVLFYYFLLSTVMVIPIAIIQWQPIPPAAWPALIGIGFAQLFSQALIVVAYRYAPAEKIGPFVYSVIIFTALLDWLIWRHTPGPSLLLGMALVIGGGLVAIRAKRDVPVQRQINPE